MNDLRIAVFSRYGHVQDQKHEIEKERLVPVHPVYEELKNRILAYENQLGANRGIEIALQDCEVRYGRLSKNLQVVLYAAFPDKLTSKFFVSKQVERLTGYPAIYFQREAGLFARLIHPEDQERVARETMSNRLLSSMADMVSRATRSWSSGWMSRAKSPASLWK